MICPSSCRRQVQSQGSYPGSWGPEFMLLTTVLSNLHKQVPLSGVGSVPRGYGSPWEGRHSLGGPENASWKGVLAETCS